MPEIKYDPSEIELIKARYESGEGLHDPGQMYAHMLIVLAELAIAEKHIERGNDATMKAWGEVPMRDGRIEWYQRRVKALEGLLACYRAGRQPSEKLHRRLELTGQRIGHDGIWITESSTPETTEATGSDLERSGGVVVTTPAEEKINEAPIQQLPLKTAIWRSLNEVFAVIGFCMLSERTADAVFGRDVPSVPLVAVQIAVIVVVRRWAKGRWFL